LTGINTIILNILLEDVEKGIRKENVRFRPDLAWIKAINKLSCKPAHPRVPVKDIAGKVLTNMEEPEKMERPFRGGLEPAVRANRGSRKQRAGEAFEFGRSLKISRS
jgi:hypothetical protein